MLRGATITGIQSEQPTPYDLAAIQKQVEKHESSITKLEDRTPRRVTVAGVNNGLVIVPFQDVGTTNYQVDVAFIWPSGSSFPEINWAVVAGSKQTNQVSLRCDGSVGTFTLEVTITPLDNL